MRLSSKKKIIFMLAMYFRRQNLNKQNHLQVRQKKYVGINPMKPAEELYTES